MSQTLVTQLFNNYRPGFGISLTDSEGNGTPVSNLVYGAGYGTDNMPVPWYYSVNSNFSQHHILITGGPKNNPNIWVWQSGNNVYWNNSVPGNFTDGQVLCGVGISIVLVVNPGFTLSYEMATVPTQSLTYLIQVTNNYSGAISLTDSEGQGVNLSNVPANATGCTQNMPVPWYYSPLNTNFANHNIQVTGGPSKNSTIWIWQNGNSVYWSYSQPPAGEYGEGNVLCASGGVLVLTVTSSFQVTGVLIAQGVVNGTAQQFANSNKSYLTTAGNNALAFHKNATNYAGLCQSRLNASTQPTGNNLQNDFTGAYPNPLSTASSVNPANPPVNWGTMTFGLAGSADFFVGITGGVGVAIDLASGDVVGYVSTGVQMGIAIGLAGGFAVGWYDATVQNSGGAFMSVEVDVDYIVGASLAVVVGITPANAPAVFGFVLTVGVGFEAGVEFTVGYTLLANLAGAWPPVINGPQQAAVAAG